MSSSRYDIITSKVRVFLSGLLERLRQSLLQSRAKELVLLALPYQITAISSLAWRSDSKLK